MLCRCFSLLTTGTIACREDIPGFNYTDEHELHPEGQVVVLYWVTLGWYDPRIQSWSMGWLLGR